MINLYFKAFEKIMEEGQAGEPNTINLDIVADMTRLDVVEEIKKTIKNLEDNQIKLLDGYYKVHESLMTSWKVDGENIECKDAQDTYDFKPSIQYGDFGKLNFGFGDFLSQISGEVDDNFAEKIGKNRFNLLLKYYYAIGEKDENGEIKVIFR